MANTPNKPNGASAPGKPGKKVKVNPLVGHPVLDLVNLVDGMARSLGRANFWTWIDTQRSENTELEPGCYLNEQYIMDAIYPDCVAKNAKKAMVVGQAAAEKQARFLAHDFAQFACATAHWRRYQVIYLFAGPLSGRLDQADYLGPDGRMYLERHPLPFDAMYVTTPFQVSNESYSGFFACHQAGAPYDKAHPLTLIFTGTDASTTEYCNVWFRKGTYDYQQFIACAQAGNEFYGVAVSGDQAEHTERSDAMFATVQHALRALTYLAAANADVTAARPEDAALTRAAAFDEKRVRKNIRSPESLSKLLKLSVGYGSAAPGGRFAEFDGQLRWE